MTASATATVVGGADDDGLGGLDEADGLDGLAEAAGTDDVADPDADPLVDGGAPVAEPPEQPMQSSASAAAAARFTQND
jgi:hypothetical protein